jgi:hypothetical protein
MTTIRAGRSSLSRFRRAVAKAAAAARLARLARTALKEKARFDLSAEALLGA